MLTVSLADDGDTIEAEVGPFAARIDRLPPTATVVTSRVLVVDDPSVPPANRPRAYLAETETFDPAGVGHGTIRVDHDEPTRCWFRLPNLGAGPTLYFESLDHLVTYLRWTGVSALNEEESAEEGWRS
ncbi:hypothetical protein IL38_24230 [Actinopolyspora erythraea]|uniref:Uncharacterized protein n=1 Tax=Actinopolyspora erythraea TaxID=414996 RepID=A0ABR4WYE2_9ACTN|nr:hypothetical protein [Actinopolyspora erythraea]KGI79404.1 hypothetical protein IL38_24230 [Actinopolyspora erythraea]